MRNFMVFCAVFISVTFSGFGQGIESFSNMPISNSSYLPRTWIGDDGLSWTALNARTDQTMTGRSICVNNVASITSSSYPNGVSSLEFDYVRAFTGNGVRSLEVFVNGNLISTITVSSTSDVIQHYSQAINISGAVVISIGANGSQIKLDNIQWTAYSSTTLPEINLLGNSINIISGATTTSTANHTNFGSAEFGIGFQIRTFTIENIGTADLNLTTTSPYITISGPNASDFSLTTPPVTPIAAGANSTFQITFNPSSLGVRNALITIPNNDSDENPYTFAISGTGTYSNLSKISDATTYATGSPEFNSSPEYISFIDPSSTATGKFIPMKLKIMDGPDSDILPTILTEIRISVTDLAAANQLSMIKTAILTTTGGTVISTATHSAGELIFTGMSGENVTANDNTEKILHLRISINEAQVIDQTKLIFLVTSAISSAAGSAFALGNAGGAQTDSNPNDRNRLNVTATKLLFNTQPQTTSINATMPTVAVEAVDFYNRRDLNYVGSASLTSTGSMTGSPLSANFNLGLAAFSSIVHSVAGNNLFLTATSASFSPLLSSTFNITEIVYLNNDYRTKGSGTWTSNAATPAIWERLVAGVWIASDSPNYNTANNIYIRNTHTISSGGAFGSGVNIKIMSGGIFTVGHPATINSIYLFDGGLLKLNNAVTIPALGSLEVEDNGTIEFNYTVHSNSAIWTGVEKFHPNSNVILTAQNVNSDFFNGVSVNSNSFNGYNAAFGNLIINIAGSPSSDDLNILASNTNAFLAHKNLIFRKFNGGTIRVSKDSNVTSGIGGDFIVEETFANTLNCKTTGNLNFSINGNMNLLSGNTRIYTGTNGNSTFVIYGNLNLSGIAVLEMNSTNAGSAFSTINLKGNLNIASSAVLKTANDSENDRFNFTGLSLQLINVATVVATSNSKIIFNITPGSTAQLINQDLKLGTKGTFNVLSGGALNFGFDGTTALNISTAISATSTRFSSSQKSTLIITSPDGISATSGVVGNVQTSTAPSYTSLATFWYKGKSNQITGSGLPTTASGKIVYVDLETNDLTLTASAMVKITDNPELDPLGGRLEIRKGILIGSNAADFSGTGRLKMTGGEYRISTFDATIPLNFTLPGLSGYSAYDLTGGTIHLLANNQTQILAGIPVYYTLKFSGSNSLNSNYKGIKSAASVTNNITIAENAIVDVKDSSFGLLPLQPTFTMTDNARFITAGTGVKPDATGIYTLGPNTTIEFNNNGTGILQSPRLINSVPLYANIVISGSNVGTTAMGVGPNTNLRFQPLGSFRVASTGTFKLSNGFGFSGASNTAISNSNNPSIILDPLSTIEYAGENQIISSLAAPSVYKNLTISGSGQKTLGSPLNIFINENLRLNSSILLLNTNEVITVRDAVSSTLGILQIENNGQLLQINDAAINVGNGLSYKRTAQVRNLDYIYWSSPAQGFATSNLPGTNKLQWNTLLANPNLTQGNWEAAEINSTAGRGYISRASNSAVTAQSLSAVFIGKPNTGFINIPIFRGNYDGLPYDAEPANPNNLLTTKADDNWNLIGNPYPSALDAVKFLTENQTLIEGAVHIWRHESLPSSTADPYYADFDYNYSASDYTIYNKLGTSIPNTFNGKIAAGQGFMVNMLHSATSGSLLSFNNTMRYQNAFVPYDNSNFYRNQNPTDAEDSSRIWLDLINTSTAEISTILVGYSTEATLEKDYFYDSSFESRGNHSFYSKIAEEAFIIQGRSLPFNSDDIVPLGITLNHLGNLAIAIKEVDGLFTSDIPVILEDKDLGVFHDLKTAPYFFTSEIGTFDNRFQLRYGIELSNSDQEYSQSNLQIVARNGIIYLKSRKQLIEKVQIYDLLGRLFLTSITENKLEHEIPFNLLSNQPLIVKATLSNGQFIAKKIIL